MNTDDAVKSPWKWLIVMLALVAAGLSIWLTVQKLNGSISSLSGCGGGSDCANVLGSKWSMVFGVVPVSVLSALLYIAILISLWVRGVLVELLRQLGALVIIVSAVWFVVLQVSFLGSICKYCMTMHGVGVSLALLVLVASWPGAKVFVRRAVVLVPFAFIIVSSLAAIQYFGPEQETHRTDRVEVAASEGDVHSEGGGRIVEFFDGGKKYRLEALPHIGASDAEHVIVKYFDYTCEACLGMHEKLHGVLEKYPKKIAVILLPVPINKSCNPYLPEGVSDHEGACEFSLLALRVWRSAPEQFEGFHQWLFENPDVPPEAAEVMAASLIGQTELVSATDPWVKGLMEQNLLDYKTFSETTPVMPKVVIKGGAIMQGAAKSQQALEEELAQYLNLD